MQDKLHFDFVGLQSNEKFNTIQKNNTKEIKTMIKALKTLYDELVKDFDLDDVYNDYLTLNTGRNGRRALWFVDEFNSVAVWVDTNTLVTPEELEQNFL